MVKKKASLALLPLTLCLSSVPVLAATTADLEKRLEQQEKKIKRLENRLKGTRSAVKENRSRISSAADRLKINGFLSAGVAVNDGQDLSLPTYDIDDNYSTPAVSKLGIQMTFKITEDVDATAQLVSRGVDDYNIEAEWAYLSWQATNDLTFRIGRQRIPYYLLSEYLDVGYAYPWVRPPIELYNVPIQSTDGIGVIYEMAAGPVNLTFQGFAGNAVEFNEDIEADFETNQAFGGAIFAEWGPWTFRVGASRSHIDITDELPGGVANTISSGVEAINAQIPELEAGLAMLGQPQTFNELTSPAALEGVKTSYQSLALMYDDGNLLVMGEVGNLLIEDTATTAGDGGYLTVGYRFGKFMPHVTFGKYYTDSDADEPIRKAIEDANAIAEGTHTAQYAAGFGAAFAGDVDGVAPGDPAAAAAYGNLYASQFSSSVLGLSQAFTDFIVQQQSYTIGVVYDFNPRIKLKLEASHYENFGQETWTTGYTTSGIPGMTALSTTSATEVRQGSGRFSPGDSWQESSSNHTAIYSFSIDAVF